MGGKGGGRREERKASTVWEEEMLGEMIEERERRA
jgi:hypothetical protein